MAGIINSQGLQNCAVTNQLAPPEGPKAVPVSLDFSSNPSYTLDYGNNQQLAQFSILQSIFIDNSANGSSITIIVNGTGQRIVCPATSQGYFAILCQSPINLTFSSAGNVPVPCYLLNFPLATAVWGV